MHLHIREYAFYKNTDDNTLPNFPKKQGHVISNLPYYTNVKRYINWRELASFNVLKRSNKRSKN